MGDGLSSTVRRDILWITFDTAGSSVNVFTPDTGERLVEELDVGLRRGARAVVLASAKPSSWLNGVGLLLAASSRSDEALAQAHRIRGYYEALARAPVPTIAAIRGNCFGCGVELALACDWRIAEDTPATRFLMPELVEYRFMPLFGGTQRLPTLVGWERAIDLVVFGATLRARAAAAIGLVDEVAPRDRLDDAVERLLARLARRGFARRERRPPPPPTEQVRRLVAARVAELPAGERRLARDVLALAHLPSLPRYSFARGMARELAAFRRSVASPAAVAAMGFFFIRQGAKGRAIGTTKYGAPVDVRAMVRGRSHSARTLAAILAPPPRTGRPLVFVDAGRRGDCAIASSLDDDPAAVRAGGAAIAVALVPGTRAVELAIADEAPRPLVRRCWLLLEDAGLLPTVTRARGGFVAARLRAILARGDEAALVRYGFAREAIAASRAPGTRSGRRGAAAIVDALAAAIAVALDGGELAHPSQGDVLARDVAGFPLFRGSLLRTLDAVGREREIARLGRAGAGAAAEELLDGRGGFYAP